MIESFPELNEQDLLILVQSNPLSDIYYQVKLTEKEFEQICAIINKEKEGFNFPVYSTKLMIVDYDDLSVGIP